MRLTNIHLGVLVASLPTFSYGLLNGPVQPNNAALFIRAGENAIARPELFSKDVDSKDRVVWDAPIRAKKRHDDSFDGGAPKAKPPPTKQKPPPKQNPPKPKAPSKPNPPKPNPPKPNPPAKPNPPSKPNQNKPPPKPAPPANNGCDGKHGRLLRRAGLACPFWPFTRGRTPRARTEATLEQYSREVPGHSGHSRMLQIGEWQVGFLIKGKELAWFTTPNKAVEHASVGDISAIGARDIGLCSMVALVTQHGTMMVHLSKDSCKVIDPKQLTDQSSIAVKAIKNEFKPLKQDTELFFDEFKKHVGNNFLVIIATGPQAGSQVYGEFMAKELFGINKHDVAHVINLVGNGQKDNSIATFFVDYSGDKPRVMHGPTDRALTEEHGLSIP